MPLFPARRLWNGSYSAGLDVDIAANPKHKRWCGVAATDREIAKNNRLAMLMQVAAKRQPKQVDTMARDELGTCDVCGAEGLRVRSYLGKRCCSACRQVRSIVKNHPHRVERMYEEFHGELEGGSEAAVAKLQERLETNKALRAEDLKKYEDLTDKYATRYNDLDAKYNTLEEGYSQLEEGYDQLSSYVEGLKTQEHAEEGGSIADHTRDLRVDPVAVPETRLPDTTRKELEENLLTLSLAYIRQDGQTFSACMHNMQYAIQQADALPEES